MKSFLSPLLRSGGSSLALTNTRHDRIVARTLLTAFDSKSRRTGLLKHDSLPEGSALIIAPSQAIHTFSMRFSIDVAFVAKDGLVLKVRHAVPPRRIAVSWRAFAVIELPAGALETSDTKPGRQTESRAPLRPRRQSCAPRPPPTERRAASRLARSKRFVLPGPDIQAGRARTSRANDPALSLQVTRSKAVRPALPPAVTRLVRSLLFSESRGNSHSCSTEFADTRWRFCRAPARAVRCNSKDPRMES